MLQWASVEKAYFKRTRTLGAGSGSALISDALIDIAGDWVCLVEISRESGRFTLVLDADWAEMGLRMVTASDADSTRNLNALELPRPALRAVIADWPQFWDDQPNPQLEWYLAEDNVPHLSVLGSSEYV